MLNEKRNCHVRVTPPSTGISGRRLPLCQHDHASPSANTPPPLTKMKVTNISGVKVYDLSQGKTAPVFLSDRARRNLAKNPEYARRIELLQDFSFPAYSRTVSVSRDGRYVLATGGYKPHLKMFDVGEVSLKFERFVDADVVAAEILSDDFSKLCLLDEDRTLSFHAKFGHHHSIRIPHFGRCMTFDRETSDLYIATASRHILRFNLTEGRFRQSWDTSQDVANEAVGNNAVMWSPVHRLVIAAGQDGAVRLWDARSKQEAGKLENISPDDAAMTCISFEPSSSSAGLGFVVGDELGVCRVFDLRSKRPLLSKEHPYCLPVQTVSYHRVNTIESTTSNTARSGNEHVIVSSDAKQIKGWETGSGGALFNIECDFKLSSVCVAPISKLDGDSSGLIFATGDQQRVGSYFVPSLGPAPAWTSFLESLTEELEQKDQQVYDDYRFVTREELEDLNLAHLIGTSQLRAWMHGYFIEYKTFERLKAVTQPTVFEEWKRERAKAKTAQSKAKDRVVLRERVKVNAELAERSKDLATDDRFGDLFQDAEFAIDEESQEYKQIYTSGRKASVLANQLREEDEDEEDDIAIKKNNHKNSMKQQNQKLEPQEETVAIRRKSLGKIENKQQPVLAGKKLKVVSGVQSSFLDRKKPNEEDGEDDQVHEDEPLHVRLEREKKSLLTNGQLNGGGGGDEQEEIVQLPDGSMSLTFIPKSDNTRKSNHRRR